MQGNVLLVLETPRLSWSPHPAPRTRAPPILLAWAPAPCGRLGTRLLQRSFHPGWFLQGHHAVCNLFPPKFVTGSPSCKPFPGKKFPPEPRPWGHFHNAISIVPFPYSETKKMDLRVCVFGDTQNLFPPAAHRGSWAKLLY